MNDLNVIITSILVLVTLYYAIQNHHMVIEMRKSREESVRPYIDYETSTIGLWLEINLINLGAGVALDVKYTDTLYNKQGNTLSLGPGKKFNIIRVSKDAFRDITKDKNIEINVTYRNIYGTQFNEKINIELDQRTKENLAAQKIPFPDSIGYYLEHIEEQLKFVNQEITQIKNYQGHQAKKSGFIPGISAPA
jgi:hypothetical protein